MAEDSGYIQDDGLLSGLNYKGTWNANTNTPTLGDDGEGGEQGDYYIVGTAGNTSIDGESDWELRDWIMNNGDLWQKVDHSPIGEIGLDEAYDKGGSGVGRQITVDAGAVELIGSASETTLLYIDNTTNKITANKELIRLSGFADSDISGSTIAGVSSVIGATADVGTSDWRCYYARTLNTAASQGIYQGVFSEHLGDLTLASGIVNYRGNYSGKLNHANAYYEGIYLSYSVANLTNYSYFYGIHLTMPDDPTPQNNPIYGMFVEMPASYTGSAMIGGRFTGDGREVQICNTSNAIQVGISGGAIGGVWFEDGKMVLGGNAMVDNEHLRIVGDFIQEVHTDDISNPPLDAELDAIFGTPATVGAGFTALIDDNAGGANFYIVRSDGTNWWITSPTKAA